MCILLRMTHICFYLKSDGIQKSSRIEEIPNVLRISQESYYISADCE